MKGIQFPNTTIMENNSLNKRVHSLDSIGCRNGSMSGIGDWARSLIGRGIRNKGVFPRGSDRTSLVAGHVNQGVVKSKVSVI